MKLIGALLIVVAIYAAQNFTPTTKENGVVCVVCLVTFFLGIYHYDAIKKEIDKL